MEVPAVSVVAFPGRLGPTGAATLAAAVDRYLDSIPAATTRASYDDTLARLIDLAGGASPVADLTPDDFAAVMQRWNTAAAATWNRHLSALTSFTTWAQRQELLATNPARRLTRRKPARRGARAVPLARLGKLFGEDAHGLRERVLWPMLYETAAPRRRDPLPQLRGPGPGVPPRPGDLQGRRDRVRALGHRHRPPASRLLKGRTTGPVFLADRRAPASGPRAPAAADICPATGRGRLSCPRAEYLFKTATRALDPHGKGWTLHQLRHSALQHLAAAGRTAAELQAKSRHAHLASLGTYVRLGEATSAKVTADADPAARRRTR
ncbi:tyrosine-type recombinase/integrase [Actinomadura welshii]|uniref:tyrosine-type recombinase/integrase n=1 Tax=Actinomadura welshii TaxID=3103817 RepID=UPI00190F96F9|nr:site-specific integrase [Actinomadura madurae]